MRVQFLAVLVVVQACASQEGAEYLASAIRDLRTMNLGRRSDALSYSELRLRQTTPQATYRISKRAHEEAAAAPESDAPPLTLTKGELAAIYENAITKGKTVKLDPGTGNVIHAAVHEIDSHPESSSLHAQGDPSADPGYYYYYYPLKSFLDNSDDHPPIDHHAPPDEPPHHIPLQAQYHSHTHQHNVQIAPMKAAMDNKKKALEPLFMAISGFIGMAVMFVLSAVVLPKFGVLKSRGDQQFSPQLSSLARVALMAIEGKGCSERIACEIGKTANAFHLYDNRFVKLIRRISPMIVRRQIDKVGKYTDKKLKCTALLCKKRPPPKPKHTKLSIK